MARGVGVPASDRAGGWGGAPRSHRNHSEIAIWPHLGPAAGRCRRQSYESIRPRLAQRDNFHRVESNYLTASIAFVALIIVPALLVGLAPPFLLTYGRSKLDAATGIGSHPVWAVSSLAVLVGVALWIGRPLLTKAVDNLWHLHYTLVFPIFVGLRETISAIIEQLPGETRASARLDRRRRIGTAIAAILMAGGGLLLAWSVGVLANPGLTDVVMQPWAVAQAGLSNAAVFLGLSTAAASLFWLWRELASRRPLRDWSPGPPISHTHDRTGGASVRPARGRRAVRLSDGMRHARPTR